MYLVIKGLKSVYSSKIYNMLLLIRWCHTLLDSMRDMEGVLSETGTTRAPGKHSVFLEVSVLLAFLVFCVVLWFVFFLDFRLSLSCGLCT